MKPFETLTGTAAVLNRLNVDTDQIIPKQFLKRIERNGFEDVLFYDWRFKDDGTEDPAFALNQPRYRDAAILVAGDNFGCGSSREHAVWALENYGFKVILSSSFADIFFNNCFRNGVLPIVLEAGLIQALMNEIEATPEYQLVADLEKQELRKPDGTVVPFEVDAFRRKCLLEGLDDVALTLQHEKQITAYETGRLEYGALA